MARYELTLPKMGESVAEATITNWLKNVGDNIEEDEAVLEIATDKVDSEVPSEVSGKLVEILFNVDDVVQVGQTIAIIETEATETTPIVAPKEADAIANQINDIAATITSQPVFELTPDTNITSSENRFYSPLVKNIAKEEGISQAELDTIIGSGKDGRVTKDDILNYINSRTDLAQPTQQSVVASTVIPAQKAEVSNAPKPQSSAPSAQVLRSASDEIIEMDRMGKMIAHHMVQSVQTSAHVQSFIEVDVTNIVNWRNKVKATFEKQEGEKLTFTPIFMEAVAKAIRDFPMMNISVDGDKIIKKKNINLGMAAALPNGNLIVPVIKNADQFNLVGLAKQVNDLANRARNNQLKPDEIQGGTYTVTNVGTFGSVFGTPIINQPQVGILALGAIRKMPAVIETPDGDFIGIRHKMFLSHSYDHRVVNGALGGQFVQRVAQYLEQFDINKGF